jgi:hypothetical protein
MSAVVFTMYKYKITNFFYFNLGEKAGEKLQGRKFLRLDHMRLLLKLHRISDHHGPYLIKETDIQNDTHAGLCSYVNTLTPEQLVALKI